MGDFLKERPKPVCSLIVSEPLKIIMFIYPTKAAKTRMVTAKSHISKVQSTALIPRMELIVYRIITTCFVLKPVARSL